MIFFSNMKSMFFIIIIINNNYIFQDYIGDLVEAMMQKDNEEYALECLGIMGNLTIPELNYELILKEYNLVPWIKNKLQPGRNDLF